MVNGGGHCNRIQSKVTTNRNFTEAVVLPTSVNPLTEAGALSHLPQLRFINRGCRPNLPTYVNVFTEAVALRRRTQLKD